MEGNSLGDVYAFVAAQYNQKLALFKQAGYMLALFGGEPARTRAKEVATRTLEALDEDQKFEGDAAIYDTDATVNTGKDLLDEVYKMYDRFETYHSAYVGGPDDFVAKLMCSTLMQDVGKVVNDAQQFETLANEHIDKIGELNV